MTLISALISINGTAIATDSLLTLADRSKPDSVDQVEWELPKLVRLEKFNGTISFWGAAVAAPVYPLPKNKKETRFSWTLYDWLTAKCRNVMESNIEDFVKRLTGDLKQEYARLGWLNYGLGMHVTGYEYIDNTYIPELFLVSNYTDPIQSNDIVPVSEENKELLNSLLNVKIQATCSMKFDTGNPKKSILVKSE